MEYIKRIAENVIEKQEKMFKVIFVTGARQVGITTMLRNIKSGIKYVTLDDIYLNKLALDDPKLFLKSNESPIIIDEIQYATILLREIKKLLTQAIRKQCFILLDLNSLILCEVYLKV